MRNFLIVVDIQNDFVDRALGTPEAEGIIDNAVDKIKNFDGEIFVTYDTHYKNYLETSEGKKLPIPHCIKGTYGWKLNEKIEEALSDKKYSVIEKNTFASVELPELIKKSALNTEFTIELIGLCTDICVVSNALLLKANFPECEISVDASCCAGVTPTSHNSALQTMKSCQINITGE